MIKSGNKVKYPLTSKFGAKLSPDRNKQSPVKKKQSIKFEDIQKINISSVFPSGRMR